MGFHVEVTMTSQSQYSHCGWVVVLVTEGNEPKKLSNAHYENKIYDNQKNLIISGGGITTPTTPYHVQKKGGKRVLEEGDTIGCIFWLQTIVDSKGVVPTNNNTYQPDKFAFHLEMVSFEKTN